MKKIVLAFLFSVILLGNANVFAMTPTWPYDAKFTRGVSNTCYYVDSSASGYLSQVDTAMGNWVDTGYGWNPIYATPVSSNYASHIDIYGSNIYDDGYLDYVTYAYTSFWNTDGTLVCEKTTSPSYNYFYTEIIMNMTRSESYETELMIHEMGHAFGLAHSSSLYSVMYPGIYSSYVSTVQKEDHDTINYLYN